jgi:ribosomal protein S18 acetylase RimI-like enzyme
MGFFGPKATRSTPVTGYATVRLAQVGDLCEISLLDRGACRDGYRTRDLWRTLLYSDNTVIVVANRGGTLAGAALGEWNGRFTEISFLAVQERHRDKGVGGQMLRAMIAHLRARRQDARVQVQVSERNLPAQLLLRQHGFKIVHRRPRAFGLDEAWYFERRGSVPVPPPLPAYDHSAYQVP